MFLGGNFIWFIPSPHHNHELSEEVSVLKVHNSHCIDAGGSKDQKGKGICTPGAVGAQTGTSLMSLLGCPSCLVGAGVWGRLGWNVGLDGWGMSVCRRPSVVHPPARQESP